MEYNAETQRAIQSFISNTPAFLYVAGPSGCGKTRLIHRIKSDAQRNNADCRILMMDAYILVERLIDAFQSKTYPALVEEFVGYNMLLVDMLEDLGGKNTTVWSFIELFKELLQKNVSVAVSLCIRESRPTDVEIYTFLRQQTLCEHQFGINNL